MSMYRVAIIVLNWNGISDTLECLKSFEKQSYKNFSLIVVDNGSSDDSKKSLSSYKKQTSTDLKVIFNKKNLGFTGGVNVGINYAIKNDFDYVALFNNDAVADKRWLEALISAIDKKKDIGICTGLLLHRDGKTIDSTGDWYSIWGLPFPRLRNAPSSQSPKSGYVFGATGGATIYKVAMLKQIGLFDDDFFAYYEDVDISFRAQLAGWKVWYEPKAIAYHEQGSSSNKISGFGVYQTFKNLPLLYIKNVPKGLLRKIGPKFYLAYILMFLNAFKNKNGKAAWRGLIESISLQPKKRQERKLIQKKSTVDIKYIEKILWNDLPPDQTGLRKFRKALIGR